LNGENDPHGHDHGEAAVRATEAVNALRDEPSAAVLAESVLFRLEALRAARAGSGGVPWIAVLTAG
jgi:hypothetical protein